jgi:hypothetical protein
MIPQRFVTEYPERCEQLLTLLEPHARERELVGSFALLVASAAFTIPFARMTEKRHVLGEPERELSRAMKRLEDCSFLEAAFWNGAAPGFFRYAKIVNDPEVAAGWRDTNRKHPMQSTEVKDGNTVLRTIRNALAHGNVVYLDENGYESPGQRLRYLAFLSKHEDRHSHRVVIFGEEDFLSFLKAWIAWVRTFPSEDEFAFAEGVE